MSGLAERFRELDRADAFARSLADDDPRYCSAWSSLERLAEQLYGDPADGAPSWAERSWDHTDPTDPAVRMVTHDGPTVTVETGTGEQAVEVSASVDVTTQPDGAAEVDRLVATSRAVSLTPAAARSLAAALLDAADIAEHD